MSASGLRLLSASASNRRGGARCAPNGRPRTRSTDVHPAGGRNDVFTMRTALLTSPPPRPVAFFTSKGPLSGRAELPFSERPVLRTEATGDTIPPKAPHASLPPSRRPPVPIASGRPHMKRDRFSQHETFRAPVFFPTGRVPATVPSPRTGTGNRPASYLPTPSGRTVSAGRSAGLRLTGRHSRSHFSAFSFSMKPLAASFCPGLPRAMSGFFAASRKKARPFHRSPPFVRPALTG